MKVQGGRMRPYTETRFKGTPDEVREQWLAERKKGIGGSDAAGVLGLSKYSTPLTVWMEKTGRSVPEDISGKEPVYWGNVLEDVVAAEFSKRHPELKVRRLNALLRSVEHPFMQASLDRVVTDGSGRKGVLEIKTCDARLKGDWEGGIPGYYLPQPIHYLAVTGFAFYCVAVLCGGNHYADFHYERDQEDVDHLVSREAEFWRMVEDDVMPEPTAASADAQALAGTYPSPGGRMIDALDEDFPEIGRLADLKKARDEADAQIRELQNALKKRIGEHKGIQTPTFKVSWVRSESARFDQKAFREANPALAEKYTTTVPRDGGLRITEVA